jgi:hypothetical protein
MRCCHQWNESCVCRLVGHKVLLGDYNPTIGRYPIRGTFQMVGAPSGEYLVCKDQAAPPSILARLFKGRRMRDWDQFADEQERTEFLNAQNNLRAAQRDSCCESDAFYSFSMFSEMGRRKSSMLYDGEARPNSPFSQ